MNTLSTIIRYYLLAGIVLLIPFTSSNQKTNTVNKMVSNTPQIMAKPSKDELKPKKTRPISANRNADNEREIAEAENKFYLFNAEQDESIVSTKAEFWTTVHSIESKQGKLLYRPSNKKKNCDTTASPCGHHQLSLQALKDISCLTKQCKRDREDFTKSLAMSKKLLAVNDKRLQKAGYTNLPEYQEYLIHQQGAKGLKTILASSKGKKLLSRNLKKNMAGNSPFSYRTLKRMGSKLAAKKFLKHWERKWEKEKESIASTQLTQNSNTMASSVDNSIIDKVANNTRVVKKATRKEDITINIPLFNNYELQIALNLKM